MALLSMAVYDTVENKRTDYTRRTLVSLSQTVDWSKHRLIVVDNDSCIETKHLLNGFVERDDLVTNQKLAGNFGPVIPNILILTLSKNIGTAEAINQAWKLRLPGENAIKMDNDVVINQTGWVEQLEEAIRRDSTIGIVGLKRKDCWENPDHPDPFYRSKLKMLPHNPGEPWMIAEYVSHVMGTCQMYSDALLKEIGYLYQIGLYGFDDSFAAFRCIKAGFKSAFLPHIDIDHIDAGDTPYQKWKNDVAGEVLATQYREVVNGYMNGTKSIYYNPFI